MFESRWMNDKCQGKRNTKSIGRTDSKVSSKDQVTLELEKKVCLKICHCTPALTDMTHLHTHSRSVGLLMQQSWPGDGFHMFPTHQTGL